MPDGAKSDAAIITDCYAGAPTVAEGRKLAAHIMAVKREAGGRQPDVPRSADQPVLNEKEAVMRAAAEQLGRTKIGIGSLKGELAKRGEKKLAKTVGLPC